MANYHVDAQAQEVTSLQFSDQLGNPPVDNVIVILPGLVITLSNLINGTITVGEQVFMRGDTNDDGQLGVSDVVATLGMLFSGELLSCPAAADTNGDSHLDLSDPIGCLMYLFVDGSPPSEPFPNCGPDPVGSMECDSYSSCP